MQFCCATKGESLTISFCLSAPPYTGLVNVCAINLTLNYRESAVDIVKNLVSSFVVAAVDVVLGIDLSTGAAAVCGWLLHKITSHVYELVYDINDIVYSYTTRPYIQIHTIKSYLHSRVQRRGQF